MLFDHYSFYSIYFLSSPPDFQYNEHQKIVFCILILAMTILTNTRKVVALLFRDFCLHVDTKCIFTSNWSLEYIYYEPLQLHMIFTSLNIHFHVGISRIKSKPPQPLLPNKCFNRAMKENQLVMWICHAWWTNGHWQTTHPIMLECYQSMRMLSKT